MGLQSLRLVGIPKGRDICLVRCVNTACAHPEVLQSITPCLVPAEADLIIP